MRDKTPLALMEQAVMILVFAIAAAICVQAFVYCGTTSKRLERSGAALTAVSSLADAVKAGDINALARFGVDFVPGQDIEHCSLDTMGGLPCSMYLSLRYSDSSEYLWTARLEVADETGELLAGLDISGQRGGAA